MSKLWDKGDSTDPLVEQFTVADDYILDQRLVTADAAGSLAHAIMLHDIGLLSKNDLEGLQNALVQIIQDHGQGIFVIRRSDEDCHTAIENKLVELCGDAGKKIHLGRSRNDQVMTALRLWMRSSLFRICDASASLVRALGDFAETYREQPMPGRTHMQPAMPSSVGLWAGGFAELFLGDLVGLTSLYDSIDQCPLGSSAGYGTPLDLDRELTARLLGFGSVQNNVVYCGLSRGKIESVFVEAVDQLAISLSKLASDLILFSLPEFGWFSLPVELCTGSSIMPQKRNPDCLELMRSRSASIGAMALEIKAIIRNLPSGYNRDYQDTKRPLFQATDSILMMLGIAELSIRKLEVNKEKLMDSFTPGIFATDVAFDLARQGKSFRDAYRDAAEISGAKTGHDPFDSIRNRRSSGEAGNLGLELASERLAELENRMENHRKIVSDALGSLASISDIIPESSGGR